MATQPIEVVFSFDTTGSMYPCLTQVRRNVKSTVSRLFEEIPTIRIGVVAHGDYCDAGAPYITKHIDLTHDVDRLCKFVETVKPTGGGDAPEAYELVLREAQDYDWTADALKVLVMIGDDVPHPPARTPDKIDWRKEADKLADAGVVIYGVQALNRSYATAFYRELANKSGGFHLTLDQFSHITDLVLAVCYKQSSDDQLQEYEQELKSKGKLNRSLSTMFGTMLKRKLPKTATEVDLHAVPPGRFQVLEVDEDTAIKEFVEENGLTFNKGRGFYEFTKTETIQGYKEVILMERATGDFYEGERARELLGLPVGESARVKPTSLEKYAVFVQSTSVNRKLMGGTSFLYEVDDWDKAAEEDEDETPKAVAVKKTTAKRAKASTKKPAKAAVTTRGKGATVKKAKATTTKRK